MSEGSAAILGSAEPAQNRFWGRIFGGIARAIVDFVRELTRDATSPYRPEKHYMRGPGPAWRAKYGTFRDASLAD